MNDAQLCAQYFLSVPGAVGFLKCHPTEMLKSPMITTFTLPAFFFFYYYKAVYIHYKILKGGRVTYKPTWEYLKNICSNAHIQGKRTKYTL